MGGDYLPFAVCEAYRAPDHPVLPRAVQADRSYAVVRSTGLAHPGRDGEDLAVGAHFRDASEGPVVVEGLPVPVVLACASVRASDDCAGVAFPVAFRRGHPSTYGVVPEVRSGRLVRRVVHPGPVPFRPCPVPEVAVRSIGRHFGPVESVSFSADFQTGSTLVSWAASRPDFGREVPSSEVAPSRSACYSPSPAKPHRIPWTVRWHGFRRT